MSKLKSNSSARLVGHSSQEQTPTQASLPPQSKLTAVLTATSPITGPRDARKWIETKGYILSGEQYNKPKLADILFTLAAEAKIPTKVKNAIVSVAFLIEDIAEEDFTASLSTKIISKFETALSLINSKVKSTKKFLSATTTQQAEATITLQKTIEDFSSNVDKLTQASTKAAELIDKYQRQYSETDWPRLGGGNTAFPTSRNPLNPNAFLLSPAEAKVQHRVLLAARQIYISIDPNDAECPTSRTIEDQRKLRDDLSRWLNKDVRFENPDYNNPRPIRGVKILKNFDILIETDTEANAELFKKHSTSILSNLCPTADICQRSYALIFKFVPCSGGFDPSDDVSLCEIELDNGTPPNSIVSASWCKHPDLQAPNQQTANLKVCCASPESANHYLKERIRVHGELVNVRMDLRMPTRCNRCQEYSHIRANCINLERCANCAGVDHSVGDCLIGNKQSCVSCGEGSDHGSTSPTCPIFKSKCDDINSRFPENSLPYFPMLDRATWASLPSNPPHQSSPFPQRNTSLQSLHYGLTVPQVNRTGSRATRGTGRPPSPVTRSLQPGSSQAIPLSSQCPVENGWNCNLRQTELPRAWSSQSQVPSSSQPQAPFSSQQRLQHPSSSQSNE
jgi:hypothetical protein